MLETISSMTLGELAGGAALLVAGLGTIIQVSPIKLNPWSLLAKRIGRAINGEVIAKVDKLEKDIQKMRDTEDERNAKAARARVLRFGDEVIHEVQHSKEHFDDILQDIGDYEHYCRQHPNFENDRMQLTSQHIKETYRLLMKEHKFL